VNLTADRSPVVASLFTRPGKALVVVMNNSDADAEAQLAPDWKALALPAPTALVDAYAEQAQDKDGKPVHATAPTVPLDNGVARFTVPKRSFRALVAR
jgi:hypothetical protein